jgi:hypothetical protein
MPDDEWPYEYPPEPGRVLLRITNMDTGHVETRVLGPDEYAILYGPELELVEDYVMPITGAIRIRLRPKRVS